MVTFQSEDRLEFTCEYCHQQFNHLSVNISVLLYGVAILSGKVASFVCLKCPNCLNSVLIECNNLYNVVSAINTIVIPEGEVSGTLLRYNSHPLYKPESIPQLEKFEIPYVMAPVYENETTFNPEISPDFGDQIFTYSDDDPYMQENFLCPFLSATDLQGPPIGIYASAWFFHKDQIEEIVEVENQQGVRVFPRYVYNLEYYEKISEFCWDYYLFIQVLGKPWDLSKAEKISEDSMPAELELEDTELKPSPISVSSETADHLIDLPFQIPERYAYLLFDNTQPFPKDKNFNEQSISLYNKFWELKNPFKNRGVPTEFAQFEQLDFENTENERNWISKIKKYRDKEYVFDFLSKYYINFIKDYIQIAQKSDFCYGHIRELRLKYLYKLQYIIQTDNAIEAQYALFKEGDQWTVIFNWRPIRGLEGGGFQYIHYLLSHPFENIAVDDLILATEGVDYKHIKKNPELNIHNIDSGNSKTSGNKGKKTFAVDELADGKTIKELKRKLHELEEEIEQAKETDDEITLQKCKKEKEDLLKYLKNNFTFNGRSRQFANEQKKKKDQVGKALTRALNLIEKKDKEAGQFLKKSIPSRSSSEIAYKPIVDIDWKL